MFLEIKNKIKTGQFPTIKYIDRLGGKYFTLSLHYLITSDNNDLQVMQWIITFKELLLLLYI
jgi:hypothetical protein